MITQTKARRVRLLENVVHYLTAFTIILKGLDKIGAPGKAGYGIVLVLIGALIVLGTIFHHKLERWLKHFKAITYALEAVVMSIVGYLYLKEGKQLIQYVCFFAAVMFIVALCVYIRKFRRAQLEPR
jgi:predicted MFS family arabinose efflux permease